MKIDLRAHGNSNKIDLSSTSMEDYAEDIKLLIRTMPRAPVLIGWSMGGLLAMMVASKGHAVACVSLAPSMPAQERDSSVLIRMGEFGPEEYGITSGDPPSQTGMADLDTEERIIALSSVGLESRMARDERKAGIRIDKMTCPLMIMTGTDDEAWPFQTYQGLWIPFTHQRHTGCVALGPSLKPPSVELLLILRSSGSERYVRFDQFHGFFGSRVRGYMRWPPKFGQVAKRESRS